ncbi:fructosamine Kinase PKL/CAK/FruK [Coprinopsis cinerea okayama7|uniref:protein-ribulosamine 3-kinase n=1 Tax=Coprinopsis cinerea (strain Okayama-7 / 130 / ATCC MYA-4618 / FGSC 9003) TaxID=240176 RepID=A8N2R7_COPC7|nr:fructosamine Kinase PKL/CAK/FruK [Coprinopsis cinerea okayama7\|eukprot:XP_001829139.2 fructosamine Kinase PKL/CAK/FruK [Coprinopsis cinerea okayama7\
MYGALTFALKQELDKIDTAKEYSGNLPKIQSKSGRSYFVKQGSPAEQEQYVGEAESLKAIQRAAPGLAPEVYAYGTLQDGKPYFISEYKNMGHLTTPAAKELAKRLANELHQLKSLHGFGFHVPTHCGPTRFENGWYPTWEKCYSAMYQHLISEIRRKGGKEHLCKVGDKVISQVIPRLLGHLVIQPVLLHGDLWSGNVGVDEATKKPVIYDPASFYGHNESDLAIARIFGGFPQTFFDTYFENNPKTEPVDEFDLRAELYEAFHYLNHTVIFGGHYARHAETKLTGLLEAIERLGPVKQGNGEDKEQAALFEAPDPTKVN